MKNRIDMLKIPLKISINLIGISLIMLFFCLRIGLTQDPQRATAEKRYTAYLTAVDKEKITVVRKALIKSSGHDYSGLYSLLKTKKGKKEEIFAISEELNAPLFVLKKASQQNPQLRTEIARELDRQLRIKYGDIIEADKLEEFIRNHVEECLLGIPQYIY